MFASKVIAAFAVVGIANAASSTTTASQCSQTTTITAAADATALATACPTFTGDIAFATAIGNTLALDGLEVLDGSLIVQDLVELSSLSSGSLTTVTGTMNLLDLTVLSTLQFPKLKTIGTINWTTLPALQQLTFTNVVDTCSSMTISDTQLSSLDGINLATVATIEINNNRNLKIISTQVANITNSLDITSNGKNLAVEFPNLIWAGNMTFRNCSSITLNSLAAINNTLGFYENYFESLVAPNLTTVGGELAFVANPSLNNITMDALTKVGGLQIANNSALDSITDFNALSVVSGALEVTGNFSEFTLPALTQVSGAVNIVTSSTNFSCDAFDEKHSNGDWTGSSNCKPGTKVTSNGGTTTSSGSATTTSTKSDAGHLYVQTTFGVIGGFLAMLL